MSLVRTLGPAILTLCTASLAFGCGDDDGGVDGGLPDTGILFDARMDAPPPCRRIRSGGAPGGDGSPAAPFASIDEAMSMASEGDVFCLEPGEHAPPTEAINVAVTFEAVSPDMTTAIAAAAGACRTIPVPNAFTPETTVELDVLLESNAPVVFRDITLLGCQIGLFLRDGGVLERVRIERSTTNVLVIGGLLDVRASSFRPMAMLVMPLGLGRIALFGISPATIQVSDDTVMELGDGLGIGVWTYGVGVQLADLTINGGVSGFFLDGRSDNPSIEIGPNVTISNLDAFSEQDGINAILASQVRVDGLDVTNVEGIGFGLKDCAAATVENVSLSAADSALIFEDSTVELGGTNVLDVPADGFGVTVRGTDGASTTSLRGSLTVTGADAIHVTALGGDFVMQDTAVFRSTGASVGAIAFAGGEIAFTAGDAAVTGATSFGIAAYFGTVAVTNVAIEGGFVGLYVEDGLLSAENTAVTGARIGVATGELGILQMTGGAVRRSTSVGVQIDGSEGASPSSLTGVLVEGGLGTGVRVSGGRRFEVLDASVVQNNEGRGLEAKEGAYLVVRGSTVSNNLGVGVGFFGAEGEVFGTTFGGTRRDATRADEIRAASDVGDFTIQTGANNFDLDIGRDCTTEGCALELFDGAGMTGIVMPNCLVASGGEAATRTVVDQDGATVMFSGPSAWASALAGIASDLGLPTGAAGSTDAPPPAADPVLPPIDFSPP